MSSWERLWLELMTWPVWMTRFDPGLVLLLLCRGWGLPRMHTHRGPDQRLGCWVVFGVQNTKPCYIRGLGEQKPIILRVAFFLLVSRSKLYPEICDHLYPAPAEVSGAHGRRHTVRARMGSPESFGMVLSAKLLHAHRV